MFFDATTVAPSSTYDALPAGDYPAMVTAAEVKPTKMGNGKFIELTIEVQGGEFQGRRLWDRINYDNPNPKAVEIAQRQLSALCHAVNQLQLASPDQLTNKPMIVKVACKQDPERGLINEIKGYKARAAGATAAQPAFAAPRAAAPATAAPVSAMGRPGSSLPWATAK